MDGMASSETGPCVGGSQPSSVNGFSPQQARTQCQPHTSPPAALSGELEGKVENGHPRKKKKTGKEKTEKERHTTEKLDSE